MSELCQTCYLDIQQLQVKTFFKDLRLFCSCSLRSPVSSRRWMCICKTTRSGTFYHVTFFDGTLHFSSFTVPPPLPLHGPAITPSSSSSSFSIRLLFNFTMWSLRRVVLMRHAIGSDSYVHSHFNSIFFALWSSGNIRLCDKNFSREDVMSDIPSSSEAVLSNWLQLRSLASLYFDARLSHWPLESQLIDEDELQVCQDLFSFLFPSHLFFLISLFLLQLNPAIPDPRITEIRQ